MDYFTWPTNMYIKYFLDSSIMDACLRRGQTQHYVASCNPNQNYIKMFALAKVANITFTLQITLRSRQITSRFVKIPRNINEIRQSFYCASSRPRLQILVIT